MVLPKVNKKILLELLILLILLGLIVLIVLKYYHAYRRKYQNQTASEEPTAQTELYSKIPSSPPPPSPLLSPKPSPIPLPPGKGTYNVSQGKHQGPTISQVSFDPLDARSGQKLTITVKASDQTPITSVSAVLLLDKTQKNLTFELTSGDALSGDWQTSIKIDDTLWYRYILTIKAVSANGSVEAIIAPRS